jgi:pilus assembly protein CpaE
MSSFELPKQRKMIQVLIIAGQDPVADWIGSVIVAEADMAFLGLVRNVSQALPVIEKLSPDVILVDISSGILEQGDLINRLGGPVSGPAIIVVSVMGEVETVRRAMLYGAQGFLLKPFTEEELKTSVRQAYSLTVQRRAELSERPALTSGVQSASHPRAEIIAVFSPKGGVGCTTVAVNLAVALNDTIGKPVALVDADLNFGDVDTALNICTTTNIGTLLPHLDELDNEVLERALFEHSSGIKVLVAPSYLDVADTIQPEQLSRLLVRLAELGQGYIVVDVRSSMDDCTLSILDTCQHLVVVTTPQVTALRDTHRFLAALELLRFGPNNTLIVLNHCYQYSSLRLKEVERALGRPIAQTIDYAPDQVTASLNRGIPLLQEYRDSRAAQDILQLANLLTSQGGRQERSSAEIRAVPSKGDRRPKRGLSFRGQAAAPGKARP